MSVPAAAGGPSEAARSRPDLIFDAPQIDFKNLGEDVARQMRQRQGLLAIQGKGPAQWSIGLLVEVRWCPLDEGPSLRATATDASAELPQAKWPQDSQFYSAKIVAATPDHHFLVEFEGYGDQEILTKGAPAARPGLPAPLASARRTRPVPPRRCRAAAAGPRGRLQAPAGAQAASYGRVRGPDRDPQGAGHQGGGRREDRGQVSARAPIARAPCGADGLVDAHPTTCRKRKLIKNFKKQQRFAEMDNVQKQKADNWKSFLSGKGSKGPGAKRESIFA